ncbi:unnamed protein product [Hydatigera taeniaeformis]|uniref:Uncharacterized protein n=1 Tax=Hydatigena taeniaeformis TaxID=6205 RepID=A0A3P7F0G6_HYDTA|nr:unnamed protein product [Hydatigera taeniaeformis]
MPYKVPSRCTMECLIISDILCQFFLPMFDSKPHYPTSHLYYQSTRKCSTFYPPPLVKARTMFHASQESAQMARNQVTHLSEEVAALQIQLNAVNTALKAAVADAASSVTCATTTLHRIPAPLGSVGGARNLRSRLARKSAAGETEHQMPVEPMTSEVESEVDHLPPLENARSPTRLHRVSSLSSPRRPLLIPSASIGGLPFLPSPLPINFCFSGHLDVPGKPGRRKKLVWDQRFAKLTFSRFLVWDTIKSSDSAQSSAPLDSLASPLETAALGSTVSATSGRKASRPGPNLLLDLPLNAILHVRSVTSCDVLHAPAEDLPRIFQIIFDQCEAGGASSGGTRQTSEVRVSSPDSSPHCPTSPPPKSSPSTGLLGWLICSVLLMGYSVLLIAYLLGF